MDINLYCAEGNHHPRAYQDPVFLKDNQVLKNLIKLESYYAVQAGFLDAQTEIRSYMRKIVVEWLFEVCEEQQCELEVFPLTINILDRFLAVSKDIKHTRLQLLATSCLFIASKLKQTIPLSAELLVSYTDYSIKQQDLLNWEILVLSRLKWDVTSVIPIDYLDILLDRLRLPSTTVQSIKKMAVRYICITSIDEKSVIYSPSVIACSCICAALKRITSDWRASLYLRILHDVTGLKLESLTSCQEHIQMLINSICRTPEESVKNDTSFAVTPTKTLQVRVN